MKNPSYANRGMQFEELINYSNRLYENRNIAIIHKVPTEFIPIRDRNGKIISCKVEHKSCVDYLGRYGNIPIAIEAKNTNNERIEFKRVEPHQGRFLSQWERDGNGLSFVLVSFSMQRFYLIPWDFWEIGFYAYRSKEQMTVIKYGQRWQTPNKASLTEKDMLPQWQIKGSNSVPIDYLDCVHRLYAPSFGEQDLG